MSFRRWALWLAVALPAAVAIIYLLGLSGPVVVRTVVNIQSPAPTMSVVARSLLSSLNALSAGNLKNP